MTQEAINYAQVLYELQVPEEAVVKAGEIFKMSPPLKEALENPVVPLKEKQAVIDRVFAPEVRNFLKLICKYQTVSQIPDIVQEYKKIVREHKHILSAELIYAAKPQEEQIASIKEYLKKEYQCQDVELELKADPQLLGGFVLKVGNEEYDWSYSGRLKQLQQKLIRR
ncbi:F-type ATPase subunit delta [uncultured Roseburia sp.]|uniref:ATP synthase subunit delta n=1 Tax=Brotonthovivens ammoniilytica TaxID=2981725 RepID=A0ABT2TPS9_9FIRM|nr:ATP synthase F1 subunit delta [Brotonthovivens ammoniilytica]MCU6763607.1 ATP synthase F1 subunit delta [Brotonthovivens ammoniilytica]SCJ26718.1 F-type ATPase subunit delta [uncultured Roseburia sp.]